MDFRGKNPQLFFYLKETIVGFYTFCTNNFEILLFGMSAQSYKKSILHIYKLNGTYLILFGMSFTHLSHKKNFIFIFSDCFHKILHILHVHSLVLCPILLQVLIILPLTIMLEIFINLLMLFLK